MNNMMGTMDMSGSTQMNHHNHHSMSGTTEMNHNMHNMNHNNHNMGSHMNMPDMDMCSMDGMGMMNHSMEMKMYFHTGTCEHLLFKELLVSNAGEMVGACIAIFFFAFLYEGLKVFREYLLRKALTPHFQYETTISKYSQSQDTMVIDPQTTKSNGECSGNLYSSREIKRQHIISTSHFVQTGLHILQVFMSYLLMLVFMTYNVWLCLAVILGAGTGYFMFGWKRAVVVDVNEHCH